MGSWDRSNPAKFRMLVTVRCLDCGEVYAKPRDGGTVAKNPGCPSCGYVGWRTVSRPAQPPSERPRSDADPLPSRYVLWR